MNSHDRISIAPFPEVALASIARWRSDRKVNRHIRPGYRSLVDVQKWYSQYFCCDSNHLFGIYVGDELVGYCTIERVDQENRTCEVGLVIGEKNHWRKGVGKVVIRQILRKCFDELKMHRVEASINSGNIASIHCFSKAGFQLEGRFREAKYRGGRYIDVLLYSILAHEFTDETSNKSLHRTGKARR